MLIIKQRILSGFGAPAAAALLLSAFAGVAKAGDEPAYTRALEPAARFTLDNCCGRAEAEDHVWLELDPYAAAVSAASEPSTDLLARLRREFSLEPVMNARVEAELNWFLRNPKYVDRVFTRAQRYLPFIVEELQARGLPMELALLPIVESAFDPFAYSHGRAAGLWQMIPGTARRFGIKQNWWYDGR
ncbi:MAG TPA: transglycosylase SLT domain-containing protein, partial [Pseudomonadales bacterium]